MLLLLAYCLQKFAFSISFYIIAELWICSGDGVMQINAFNTHGE